MKFLRTTNSFKRKFEFINHTDRTVQNHKASGYIWVKAMDEQLD